MVRNTSQTYLVDVGINGLAGNRLAYLQYEHNGQLQLRQWCRLFLPSFHQDGGGAARSGRVSLDIARPVGRDR